jgi:hypothetical protein
MLQCFILDVKFIFRALRLELLEKTLHECIHSSGRHAIPQLKSVLT